ncbi:copper chaperone PCu(A)C [Corynebacterium afermentans]|uniref:copper chaperone PCu(A)C n=1 Tax=Corynebacterium afermentans TaxID=38286 RepID=UPI0025725848|nr:copper chaperone PCu(A)C [Corynebacterium afermentans]MDC7108179.1 copper chaperone PCu(A)C [Corynebacterium afermentans]
MNKRIVTGLAAAALVLAGCSDETNSAAEQQSSYNEATSEAATVDPATDVAASELDNDAVTLEQGTVRAKTAKDTADGSDITSIFGTLHNNTDKDLSVVGFTTSLGEADYQIHEVVDGMMRQKDGGFDIPAGGTHELAPGSDHFMVMGYAPAIEAGDTIDLTLLFEGGATATVPDVAVRTMLPGDESYGDIADHAEHKH